MISERLAGRLGLAADLKNTEVNLDKNSARFFRAVFSSLPPTRELNGGFQRHLSLDLQLVLPRPIQPVRVRILCASADSFAPPLAAGC